MWSRCCWPNARGSRVPVNVSANIQNLTITTRVPVTHEFDMMLPRHEADNTSPGFLTTPLLNTSFVAFPFEQPPWHSIK